MSNKIHVELRFDGGCKPTNPGPRYGSYLLLKPTGLSDSVSQEIARESCFELGHGTNNEAEWLACLAGLDRLISEAIKISELGRTDWARKALLHVALGGIRIT